MCDSWECVSLGKSGSSRIRIHCGYSCGIPPHRKQTILCSFIRLYCLRCDDSDFMSHKSVGWSFTFIFSTNEEAKKKQKKQFANFIIGFESRFFSLEFGLFSYFLPVPKTNQNNKDSWMNTVPSVHDCWDGVKIK